MEDTRRFCLRIRLEMADPDHPQSPMWPEIFEFIPFDETKVAYRIPDHITRPIGHYSVVLENMTIESNWIFLDEDALFGEDVSNDEDDRYNKEFDLQYRSVLRPQWPWILAQCLLMGDIEPYIANARLMALLYALDKFGHRRAHFHLRKFSAPRFTTNFTLEHETVTEWLTIMYPVVASFGSRFYEPCSIIKESYEQLLSECRPGNPKEMMRQSV